MDWVEILGPLTAGDDLTGEQAGAAMAEVLAGEATSAQIAAFAIALRMKGETVEELRGMLNAMLDAGESVVLPDGVDAVDTCGTGGDRSGTINISSIAAFVVAGAGANVCKHGNRAASSQCGSADVYEALGMAIDLGPDEVSASVAEAGMGFCFAPRFHPALRHAGPTRKELGVRTAFNFLGPMANPARVKRQVVGVAEPGMAERMLGVLQANGAVRALVVYGHDGLDELTTTTTSTVLELRDGAVNRYEVDPAAFGISLAQPADLVGGTAEVNKGAAESVLAGDAGPHRDVVLLNAAAGLVAAGLADDLAGGYEVATASLDDGKAAGVLETLRSRSA